MSDYIKKEDAIDVIEITPFEDYGDYIKAREIIENLPTIEAVPKDFHDKTCEAMAKRHTEEIQRLMPKRGKWIVKQSGFAECSVCEQHYFSDYNFCPNCGADIRGENNETDKEMR